MRRPADGHGLPESRPIIFRQSLDLDRRQPRGDGSHAPVDIVAALACGIHLELQGNVFLSLLGQNRGLDRTARAGPMTRGAGRDVAAGIAKLGGSHRLNGKTLW